jgi:hypothetical protein
MSDNGWLHAPLANYSAADVERLTPSERQTMNGILSKAGFAEKLPEPVTTADKIATEFHSELTKQSAVASTETPAVGQGDVYAKYSLTAKEASQAAAMLRKHWTGSPEELERALSGTPDPVAEPTRAERSAQNIEDSYRPGATASEYKLQFPPDIEAGELVKLNTEITNAFKNAQVPLILAQPLANAMADGAKTVANMNPAQREYHNRNVLYQAEKLIGQEGP